MPRTENAALEPFLKQLSQIRIHRAKDSGPSLKKPLLLLLVLARIARGELRSNQIRFSEIEGELARLLREFGGRPSAALHLEEPFRRMCSEPFWQIYVGDKIVPAGPDMRSSIVRASNCHASLSPEVFEGLAALPQACRDAASVLLDKWFAPDRHAAILSRLGI